MQRDPDEIIASQNAMLAARGEAIADGDAARSREVFRSHLAQVGTVHGRPRLLPRVARARITR